ncbi:MAG: DNA-binding protein [Ruminococcaceae bacterium]|nr:DNA-binding protein [Oscillospiraceae bacterium]
MLNINVSSEEERVKIGLLLDLYGNILTEKQKQTMDLYFQQDYSLSEISEQLSITRQAVRDSLLRAETTLFDTDARLGLLEKFNNMRQTLVVSYENAAYIKDFAQRKYLPSEIIDKLNEIMDSASESLGEEN